MPHPKPVSQATIEAGNWIHAPIRMTPELARAALRNAVQVPFADVPESAKFYLTDEDGQYTGDPDEAVSISGYYYLTECGERELAKPDAFGAFVNLSSTESYFAIGQHTHGCPLPRLADDGRLFIISYEDYQRLAGSITPDYYLLSELQTDRSSQDVYQAVKTAA